MTGPHPERVYPALVGVSTRAVTTRHARGDAGLLSGGTVAPEFDREMVVAPSIALRQGERGHSGRGPGRGPEASAEHPYPPEEGADVIRVPVPSADDTTPRRGASNRALLLLRRGVRAARTQIIPTHTSSEGAGMT